MKPFIAKLKRPIVYIPLIVVLIIIFIIYRRAHSTPTNFESTPVAIGTVKETVTVTGTVSPVGKADLSFEKSGVVSRINVAVGDSVHRGDPIATLDNGSDAAALASAQATLADMSRTLTPAELAVQKTAVQNAENDTLNAAHDSFVKAQGAIVNSADIFFTGPQGANPTITIYTQSDAEKVAINNERLSVSDTFRTWTTELSSATPDTAATTIQAAETHLNAVKTFMGDLSVIVNRLNPSNSGLSQSTINNYVTTINSGLANVAAAIDSATSAQSALASAESDYNLKLAGNSSESIAAQAARVSQAQAVLSSDTIFAPIDGEITAVVPNVGEFASAGQTSFSIESSGEYKIEAFVPEADIAKVAVGDTGSTTLDAYGSNTFFGVSVTAIDPAPTVIEGVPTYKVTLLFTAPDPRIRSGMTANLEILTHERDNVLEIPYRALVITATSTTARIVNQDGKTYTSVPVMTGLKGSEGTIEITSGLKEGDNVVTYVKN